MENLKELQEAIKKLIESDSVPQALEMLRRNLNLVPHKTPMMEKDLILFAGQYNNLKQQKLLGTINPNQAHVQIRKVLFSIQTIAGIPPGEMVFTANQIPIVDKTEGRPSFREIKLVLHRLKNSEGLISYEAAIDAIGNLF